MERTGNGQQGKILTRAWGGPLGKATTAVGLYGPVKSIKWPPKCVCLCPQNSVALRFGPRNYFFQCSVVVTTEIHMVKTKTASEERLALNGTRLHLLLGSGNITERTEGQ